MFATFLELDAEVSYRSFCNKSNIFLVFPQRASVGHRLDPPQPIVINRPNSRRGIPTFNRAYPSRPIVIMDPAHSPESDTDNDRVQSSQDLAFVHRSSITWRSFLEKYRWALNMEIDYHDNFNLLKLWHLNAYFITHDHRVLSAGFENQHGVLGTGNTHSRSFLCEIEELRGEKVIEIVCGTDVVFAITESSGLNQLWVWGNLSNLLRKLQPVLQLRPQRCEGMTNCHTVVVGGMFVLVLKKDKTVWMCGWENYPDFDELNGPIPMLHFNELPIGLNKDVVQIACGTGHALFRLASGHLYGFGHKDHILNTSIGHISVFQMVQQISFFMEMIPIIDAIWISAGAHLSAFIDQSGEIWLSGDKFSVFTKLQRDVGFEPRLLYVIVLEHDPPRSLIICLPGSNDPRLCTVIQNNDTTGDFDAQTSRIQTLAEATLSITYHEKQYLPLMVKMIDPEMVIVETSKEKSMRVSTASKKKDKKISEEEFAKQKEKSKSFSSRLMKFFNVSRAEKDNLDYGFIFQSNPAYKKGKLLPPIDGHPKRKFNYKKQSNVKFTSGGKVSFYADRDFLSSVSILFNEHFFTNWLDISKPIELDENKCLSSLYKAYAQYIYTHRIRGDSLSVAERVSLLKLIQDDEDVAKAKAVCAADPSRNILL